MPTDRRTAGPRAQHRPPKHGARALARHLAAGALDRRTGIARDFYGVQDALIVDRGGHDTVSTAERILIELAAAELLIIRSIFAYAARQPSIITEGEDGPQLLGPLAKGFTSHAGALTRALGALGLERKAKDVESLDAYLARRAVTATNGTTAPPASATVAPLADVPDSTCASLAQPGAAEAALDAEPSSAVPVPSTTPESMR